MQNAHTMYIHLNTVVCFFHIRNSYPPNPLSTSSLPLSLLLSFFLHPYISISLYFRCVDFYEIIENKRLGKGSYGSVYLCKHRKTGDEFACKVSQYFWLRSFSFFAVIFFIIAGLHAINYSRKLA